MQIDPSSSLPLFQFSKLPAAEPAEQGPRDEVRLGGAEPSLSMTSMPKAAPKSAVDALLAEMRPFIHEVFVVAAGKDGAPPILSGTPVIQPESLPAAPSTRWTVTPDIEAWHRKHTAQHSNQEFRAADLQELKPLVEPVLRERYGDRTAMNVVELGPATSTIVPDTLKGGAHRYMAMDLSLPLLEKNRDLLNEEGYRIAGTVQVQGDTYGTPVQSGVCDVVFTSCHPPFVSASPQDKIRAFSEVARMLRPEGEFLLFPWGSRDVEPEVQRFVDATFDKVASHPSRLGGGRNLVVLRKKP